MKILELKEIIKKLEEELTAIHKINAQYLQTTFSATLAILKLSELWVI